jgi:DTW domain-containing protein YfiP
VVILQHPREEHMPIGTARMAHHSLPSSRLFVGVELDERPDVRAAIEDPAHPAVLLYPGPGARDLATDPPTSPVTLVVLDGTWAHARKLLRKNPRVAALPRYAFRPEAPSEYRIRREPDREYVSTIEALANALPLLEARDVGALYEPFRAMVDMQIACEKSLRNSRGRHSTRAPRPLKIPKPLLALSKVAPRLVCVMAEANAWPYDHADSPPDELIQLVAVRPFTRESLDVVVAPRSTLAPATCDHARLSQAELAAGVSIAELDSRLRAFLRDDDVLCSWGYFATKLLRIEGLRGERAITDLRIPASSFARSRPGSLDDVLARLGRPDAPAIGRGRGGERLGRLLAVTELLLSDARVRSARPDPIAMLPPP